ncbi:Veg family protein [Leuconostocaceae bacterium ESL0958]|nr:Veg family protein [Leuconostocaceae bacterium ESL0958]
MSTLAEIKERLDAHLGEHVTVVSQIGRKKMTERTGVLDATFGSLFVVKLGDETQFEHASYSYTDILTNNVAVTFAD